MRLRRDAVKVRHAIRRPTSGLRMLPDALIIGAQRCGTSSLYKYLEAHPDVVPSLRKETEFFSRRYSMGLAWYTAHFPMRRRVVAPRHPFTFEATPDYLFDPRAPGRAAALVPEAKIVVLLRDPVERAFSHYRHMVRLGFESLPFDEALEAERARISPDVEAMRRDPLYYPRPFVHFSYASRGLYAEQLERWLRLFPRENFRFIRSEVFYLDPVTAYRDLVGFLGLSDWAPIHFRNYSRPAEVREPHEMSPAARTRLAEFFQRDEERLVELLGPAFRWPSGDRVRIGQTD